MSAVQKAEAAVVEASAQSDRFAEILAVVAAVQAVQTQATPQHHGCSCSHAKPKRSTGQAAAVAAGVCACGMVACAMFLAVALAAVGVAVSALVCLFVIREIRKGK